jgi:hypothetical protein
MAITASVHIGRKSAVCLLLIGISEIPSARLLGIEYRQTTNAYSLRRPLSFDDGRHKRVYAATAARCGASITHHEGSCSTRGTLRLAGGIRRSLRLESDPAGEFKEIFSMTRCEDRAPASGPNGGDNWFRSSV